MTGTDTLEAEGTSSLSLTTPLLRYVGTLPAPVQARIHAAFEQAWEASGCSWEVLSQPNARLPLSTGLVFPRVVAELSGDPLAMLRTGLGSRPQDWGIVGYIGASAATLGQSLHDCMRYMPLTQDTFSMELETEGEEVRIAFHEHGAHGMHEGLLDLVIGGFLGSGYENIGVQVPPLRVCLQRSAPAHAREYEAVLGCPVHFGAPFDGYVIHVIGMEVPNVAADATLHRLLCVHADELLQRLPSRRSLLERVRTLMREQLAEAPSVDGLARALAISESTLRRRLRERGHTATSLLEEVRRGEAARMLTETQMSVSEVAYALGFAQPPAFHRAFRRWFSMSPTAYRRAAVGSPLQAYLRDGPDGARERIEHATPPPPR